MKTPTAKQTVFLRTLVESIENSDLRTCQRRQLADQDAGEFRIILYPMYGIGNSRRLRLNPAQYFRCLSTVLQHLDGTCNVADLIAVVDVRNEGIQFSFGEFFDTCAQAIQRLADRGADKGNEQHPLNQTKNEKGDEPLLIAFRSHGCI